MKSVKIIYCGYDKSLGYRINMMKKFSVDDDLYASEDVVAIEQLFKTKFDRDPANPLTIHGVRIGSHLY